MLYQNHKQKFGQNDPVDINNFTDSFFSLNGCTKALDFFDGDILVCCAHYDITSTSLSAIYTYYNPAYAHYSPGKFAVLTLINMARELSLDYIYLGYYIEENCHMNYKKDYYPCQVALAPGVWHDYIDENGVILLKNKPLFLIQDE